MAGDVADQVAHDGYDLLLDRVVDVALKMESFVKFDLGNMVSMWMENWTMISVVTSAVGIVPVNKANKENLKLIQDDQVVMVIGCYREIYRNGEAATVVDKQLLMVQHGSRVYLIMSFFR